MIYNGGGATHATAYNFWHHRMAAKIAEKIGKDPTLYQREAEAIRQGMNRELWLENEGWFAEYRDWLGKRSAHASPGLWTYYHTVDSAAASAFQAWQASRFIDSRLSRIPLHGKGVPAGSFALPTTDWMPYQWSINNVALAESAHTALALWQAGRGDFALPVLKGAFLDAMFMGPCPGNVGMTSQSDRFSGERYRDFADAVGITARAVVEGVFGIQPDLIAGKLRVRPGFPADWEHASLRHAGVSVAFKREDLRESYLIESRLARPAALELVIPALRAEVASVTVNGKELGWRNAESNVGPPRIIIEAAAASRQLVVVTWAGPKPAMPVLAAVQPAGGMVEVDCGPAELLEIHDPQQAMAEVSEDRHGLRARWVGKPGPRTVFVRLRQGGLKWWHALDTEVRPALAIESPAEQTPGCLRMELTSSLSRDMEGPAVVEYAGRKHEFILRLPACGRSGMIELPADGLVPGTHPVRVRLAEGTAVEGEITNWKLKSPADHHWEMIDLGTHFNDQVGSIFRNEYRSPRSPFCSLALPKQGVGGWCHYQATAEVDDRGLRAAARRGGGVVQTPLGIPFRSPAEGRNIIFTSLWDKYPDEAAIPLSGKAGRAVLLMAGSTYAMQCRFDNGEIIARYADGSSARLVLRTPVNWWPIEQDYHIDAFAFSRSEPVPPRLDLKSGSMRILTPAECRSRGAKIPGGAATVLDLPLDAGKELESITLRTLGNEVVIGLLAVTLERVEEASPSDG